jgi:hypothetical protein
VLHQATRARDERGRIIATEADYVAVRELVLPVVSQGVGATVSPTIRETREAVETLRAEHPEGVPAAVVARALKLDKSAARRRLLGASDALVSTRGSGRTGSATRDRLLTEWSSRPSRSLTGHETAGSGYVTILRVRVAAQRARRMPPSSV